MYKLLTEEEKVIVEEVYTERRATVMLVALVLILMMSVIGLLPSYLLSQARKGELTERLRIMDELGQKGDEEGLGRWLARVNRELQVLSPKLDTDRPSQFIEQVTAEKAPSVHLTTLAWTKVKGKITLSIAGVATDRQSLIKFENGIKSSGHFSGVALPISNLAQDKDLNFQMKFTPVTNTKAAPVPEPVEEVAPPANE